MNLISTNADKLQHCHAICRSQADRMATLLYFGRLSDVTGNSEISFDADPIRDGDEIAFMPPGGGG